MTKTAPRGLRLLIFLMGVFLMEALFPILTDALPLSLPEQAPEDSALLSGRGKIPIPQPLASVLAVHVSSSDPSQAAVPEEVVIRAGEPSASFDITIVDQGGVYGARTVDIAASAAGWSPGVVTIRCKKIDKGPS